MSLRAAASLEVVSSEGVRSVFPLEGKSVTLGRSSDCDIVIAEPFVSGCHARIEPVDEGYVLRDAGSTNGTWVDGVSVNGGRALAHGATLTLGRPGKYRVRFLLADPPVGSTTGTHRNLQEVLEISKVILSTLDQEEALGRVLDACLRIAQAERGYLFLGSGGDLRLRASREGGASRASEQAVEFSRSVALRVAASGQAEFLSGLDDNGGKDKSESVVRLRLQNIACVPLKIQERVIGIVYLDSHRPSANPDATGRQVLEVLAGLAAIAIENTRMIQERVQHEQWSAIGRVAASIVHDIRSPLAALRGKAELLADKVPDLEHREKLKSIIGEVDRLNRLCGEMLEFSSRAQPLRRTRVSISDLIREFAATIEPRLEKEQIRLDLKLDCEVSLFIDRQKMARALHNVVGNALEAMQPGGTLTLSTSRLGDRISLAVADTGCGMSTETLARIFEPFFTHGKDHGVGLGMSIVRRIAEQHSATVNVQSKPGAGTRVEMVFPESPTAGLLR